MGPTKLWKQSNKINQVCFTGNQTLLLMIVSLHSKYFWTSTVVKIFSVTNDFLVTHHPNITVNGDCTEMGLQGQNLAAATAKT